VFKTVQRRRSSAPAARDRSGTRGAVVRDDVLPSTRTLPALGLTMPQMVPISVVFPHRLGPSKARSLRANLQIDVLESPETGGVGFESLLTEMMACMERAIADGLEWYRRQPLSGEPAGRALSAGAGIGCRTAAVLAVGAPAAGLGMPGVIGAFRRAPCPGASCRCPKRA